MLIAGTTLVKSCWPAVDVERVQLLAAHSRRKLRPCRAVGKGSTTASTCTHASTRFIYGLNLRRTDLGANCVCAIEFRLRDHDHGGESTVLVGRSFETAFRPLGPVASKSDQFTGHGMG